MYCIKNKDGQFAPDPSGDPALFYSAEQAGKHIEKLSARAPGWEDGVASISPWFPNVLHLECMDHLRDVGFSIEVNGDELHVECDTLWTAPMVDTLSKYLKGGHRIHRSYRWFLFFDKPRQVRIGFDDHKLVYTIKVRRMSQFGASIELLSDWRGACLIDLL